MVSETEHVRSVWIGFLFQTFRDWLESIRLTKIVAGEFGTGTTFVYEFRHGLPMKICILNQRNPKCLDRIWQTNVL